MCNRPFNNCSIHILSSLFLVDGTARKSNYPGWSGRYFLILDLLSILFLNSRLKSATSKKLLLL